MNYELQPKTLKHLVWQYQNSTAWVSYFGITAKLCLETLAEKVS